MANKALYDETTGFFFTKTRHTDTYPAIDTNRRDFSGRYVFITGASKGVGRETALSFAKAGAAGIGLGARSDLSEVVAAVEEAAKTAGNQPPKVVAVTLDVTDAKSAEAAASTIDKAFPRLDVLVNNAGYLESRCRIIDSDPDEWWKAFTVNVQGPYHVTRAFLPQILRKGGDKTIVNLSSIAAHLVNPGGSAYQTSKLATQRLTQFIDAEHGAETDDKVVVFGLHPGAIPTDMGKKLPKDRQKVLTETTRLPADTIVFLTEKRRPWLSGRYISATWDVEELLSREEEIVSGDKLKVRLVL